MRPSTAALLSASLFASTSLAFSNAGCSAGTGIDPSGATGTGTGTGATGTTGGSGGATSGATTTTTSAGAGGSATTTTTTTTSTGAGGGATTGAGGSSGQGGSGGMEQDGGPGPSDAGPPINAEVYAHSPGTLYKLDPTTKEVTVIGNFQGCESVIDIALDKNGLMFGTTFSGLYKINKNTAACTLVSFGAYPNSLSFVPAGTVDPVNEALVGYNGSTYVRINTMTGAVTNIGGLGNGGYSSSGDIVSIIGGGSYLTVNGDNCNDCIVEVNPKTGALVNVIGPLNYSSVFGLAFWAGIAYGFDNSGKLFEINIMTGVTSQIPIPNAPAGLQFWGAGSTTAAPVHE